VTAPSEARPAAAAEPRDAMAILMEPAPGRRWRHGWTRRRWMSIGLVVLLVAGAVVTTWQLTKKSSSGASAAPVSVTTQRVTVGTGTIKQTVSASGTIEPASRADLSFAVSGQVTAVTATVGQKVTAGQTVATIDTTAIQHTVDAATQTLASDQARLSTDRANGASTSQIYSDEAAVTSAGTQVTTAKQNLANGNLTSTIAGTVASVNLSVGQVVSGTGSGSSGGNGSGGGATNQSTAASASSSSAAQIVVVSTDSYIVNATVDDTQVGQIKAGNQVTIQASGSTATVYGTVSSVGLVAQSSGSAKSSVASFPVVVAVTGTPSGLYAGTSATLTITTVQLNNVVEVPSSAITYSNGQSTVTKVVGGKQVATAVTTGAAASGETQITSGLKAGDEIIERVVKFNGSTGGNRNVLGGSGTANRTGGAGGVGGFPIGAGGAGGGPPGGSGFPGGGG
jgi:membrane fusion protein, macrolide-specific efflux system